MENFAYINSWESGQESDKVLQLHSIVYRHDGVTNLDELVEKQWMQRRFHNVEYSSGAGHSEPSFPLCMSREVILVRSVENVARGVLTCKNYLGSIKLLSLILTFEEEGMITSRGLPRMSLAPGHEKGPGYLLVEVQEGEKTRVGHWELRADRKFDGGDHLYMKGTNNRPFGGELSREIYKLF